MALLNPAPSFEAASKAALDFLRQRLGFGLCMVTRTEGADWIVLETAGETYPVRPSDVFNWADSFCSRMVEGAGPRMAPAAKQIPAYASAPIGARVEIGSYMGVPLTRGDGSLFGTLCGIDPLPKPEELEKELPLVELLASLLSSILDAELGRQADARRAERAEAEATIDPLTGLYNRRGWDRLLAAEESRCARFGHPAFVVAIDLDGLKTVNDTKGHKAGDALIQSTGKAIARSIREQDFAARVGGDEFMVLAVECGANAVRSLLERIDTELATFGIRAAVGAAARHPATGLVRAAEEADLAMYAKKSASRAGAGPDK